LRLHSKIASLVFFIGIVALLAYKFLLPYFEQNEQAQSSDSGAIKATISIGVDNWIGYYPLCSRELQTRMRRSGYLLQCKDDQADYPGRMKKMKSGELDFAVATVDAFLLAGSQYRFPGTIISVIDESRGGDAIVAWKDKVGSLDDLKNVSGYKVAFTPQSPSEHLLKSVGVHFDIPGILEKGGRWRLEADGSEDALKKLKAKEAYVAVLWEPDVTRALANNKIHKLIGTEDTKRLIVDILLVNRQFSQEHPEIIKVLLRNYFRVLKYYRDNPARLAQDAARELKLPEKKISAMVKGVAWASMMENSTQWFGIAQNLPGNEEGLINTIESTMDILLENKDFDDNPISSQNYYVLTNRAFIESLYEEMSNGTGFGGQNRMSSQSDAGVNRKFPALTAEQWKRLREVGTLKIRPIVFQSGSGELTFEGKAELDRAIENLQHYPNYRVVVKGHTGVRGDKTANLVLSRTRAEAVVRYLKVSHNIDQTRLRFVGYGGSKPLPRQAGESDRSFNYRLPRVELYLVAEDL